MTEIKFTIKDEVARRWERTLRQEFSDGLSKVNLSLDDLVRYAMFTYMADIAERDRDLALKALEESLEIS